MTPAYRKRHILTVVAICWVICCTASFAADGADATATVQRIFDIGWDTSYSARSALDREFDSLPPAARAEPRIQYAYVLTLIKQGRHREAIEATAKLVKAYPESLTPLKTRIWLAALTEQYPQAMAEMEMLSRLLAKPSESTGQRDEHQKAARTAGLLFGYLEGPCGEKVSATARTNHQKKIQENLDTPLEDAFREGQREAIVVYLDLQQEYEQKEAEAKRESERTRIEESKRIDVERDRLVEQRKQLKEEIARQREELQSDMDALSSAEAPLLQQQAIADRNRLLSFRELNDIVDDIEFLEERLIRERDPVIRARLRREIRRLELVANDLQVEVLEAERQMALAQREIDGLRRQRAQLQANMGAKLKSTERELRNIDQREKILVADAKKLQKPILDTRPLLPLRRKIESLATYAPFPLDEEKRRLLRSLAQQ